MKKRLTLLMAILLCGMLLLVGCGGSGDSASDENITDSGNGENTIFFGLDDKVEYEGLCEMSNLYAEVLDDDAVSEGWYYYYTDTDERISGIVHTLHETKKINFSKI